MSTIKKFLDILSPEEQKKALILMAMTLVMAFLDAIGVASIMPFMAVLANPQLIKSNKVFEYLYFTLGFQRYSDFLFALGIAVFLLLIISLFFKAFTTFLQNRFAYNQEFSISKRLVERYLHQPYSWFLNRNSAELGKNALSEVGKLVHRGLLPLIRLIAQSIGALAIFLLLLIVDPILALSVGVLLGSAYGIIYKIFNQLFKRLGEKSNTAEQKKYLTVSEVFGAIKEVKLGGFEKVYTSRFADPAKIYADAECTVEVIMQLPRYLIEAIAFGGMLLVILYLMSQGGSFQNALPIIALYAFAGYRLLPSLQQIYGSLSQISFNVPALDEFHKDLESLDRYGVGSEQVKFFQLQHSIVLENISYTYPNAQRAALKDICLSIPIKNTIGFVGVSGSGKTTILDLILNLLEPQFGQLIVDGEIISKKNQKAWQKIIGYVPQQINIIDDTVEANIAFGIESENVNHPAVYLAAKMSNIHEFVVNNLEHGYKTKVGEHGVRLSGGQRQRIGIARALYHKPQLLILDEATSALDNLTEQVVMEAVQNLNHQITIIIVAHRLSTVKNCDQIYIIDGGVIKAKGTFDILLKTENAFQAQFIK